MYGVKEFDDAEVRNLPITSISVQHWLNLLSSRFRQITMTHLSEIAAAVSPRSKKADGRTDLRSKWQRTSIENRGATLVEL
jgi:hypothetical protein